MASQLQQVLQALEPRLKRQRPLARACPQLLLDLAALLSGLRPLVMLDHAAGITPAQLMQVLQPLPQLLPLFQSCILHLEGCCYVANIRQLQQHLAAVTQSSSSSSRSWPVIITFADGQAVCAQPEQCQELQQQLSTLNTELHEQLQDWQLQRQQTLAATDAGQVQPATHQRHNHVPGSSSSSSVMPVIDLGRVKGLPAMPTLNGFLLGYPAVYWMRGLQEAAAASKVLSLSRLKLHRVLGSCAAVSACSGDASGAGRSTCLMSFTVPEAVCDDVLGCRVQQLMTRLHEAAGGSVENGAAGCAVLQMGEWTGIKLSVEDVDGQPVSL